MQENGILKSMFNVTVFSAINAYIKCNFFIQFANLVWRKSHKTIASTVIPLNRESNFMTNKNIKYVNVYNEAQNTLFWFALLSIIFKTLSVTTLTQKQH